VVDKIELGVGGWDKATLYDKRRLALDQATADQATARPQEMKQISRPAGDRNTDSIGLEAVYEMFDKVPTSREASLINILEATISGLGYTQFAEESTQHIRRLKMKYILRQICRRKVIAELTDIVGVIAVREGILRCQNRYVWTNRARFARSRKRPRAYSSFTCYEDPPSAEIETALE